MITINQLTKSHGGQFLFQDAQFFIGPGEKVGLVGPNGAGKTSLFRLMIGEERPDKGEITMAQKTRLAYFSQSTGEMQGRSVLSEVMSGLGNLDEINQKIDDISAELETETDMDRIEKLLEDLGQYQTQFEDLGGHTASHRAQEILSGLGFDQENMHRDVGNFSGGQKMRIALAKVLLIDPDLLLMDEPTNYLDTESIVWLEQWLAQYKGALLMTCHDREFMNGLVKKIIEINHQKLTVYSGNYDYYEKEREIRRVQLQASFDRQQEMLSKEEEFIAKFQARASHAAQVQSRVKKLDKIDRIEVPAEQRAMSFDFPTPPRSGQDVVKIQQVSKWWELEGGEKKKVLFNQVNAVIPRLEKVAVVGVNGAGKSTFLKIIANLIEPSEGKAELGANVQVGYFSQYSIEVLNPQLTVFEELRSRTPLQKTDGQLRNLLGAFLFRGDDIDKKVSILSGGEKSRLVLASILMNPVNLLLLDEPTNHLDILSREVLLEALQKFEGTVMIISHDRFFLKKLATKVMAVGQESIQWYPGSYDYYLEKTFGGQ